MNSELGLGGLRWTLDEFAAVVLQVLVEVPPLVELQVFHLRHRVIEACLMICDLLVLYVRESVWI